MKSRPLYGFETESMGVGLALTQLALKKFDLDLHESYPIPGGKFIFLAFAGADALSAQADEFRSWLSGKEAKSLVLPQLHAELVRGLLHLESSPSEATGAVVLEGRSPLDLLACTQDFLDSGDCGLLQLNLGRGLAGKGLVLLSFAHSEVESKVKSFSVPTGTQLTVIEEIHPAWKKDYLI